MKKAYVSLQLLETDSVIQIETGRVENVIQILTRFRVISLILRQEYAKAVNHLEGNSLKMDN